MPDYNVVQLPQLRETCTSFRRDYNNKIQTLSDTTNTAIDVLTDAVDLLNGQTVPIIQILKEDGTVVWLKDTNVNIQKFVVATDEPAAKNLIWIRPL